MTLYIYYILWLFEYMTIDLLLWMSNFNTKQLNFIYYGCFLTYFYLQIHKENDLEVVQEGIQVDMSQHSQMSTIRESIANQMWHDYNNRYGSS